VSKVPSLPYTQIVRALQRLLAGGPEVRRIVRKIVPKWWLK